MAMPGARRVVLLGATSGIMRAVARELASRGDDLALVARDRDEVDALASDLAIRYSVSVRGFVLDALALNEAAPALDECFDEEGRGIDGVVVGLGYLGEQDRAERDPGEARRIVETNFTAPALLLARAANALEARGGGFLCVISSVAGDRGRQSNYVYGSAKAGLTAYVQGVRNRLHRAGVQVTLVKPGFVDTAMTYGKDGLFLVAQPESIAHGIVRAIERGRDEVYLPSFWRWIMLVIRSIPEPLFKRLRL